MGTEPFDFKGFGFSFLSSVLPVAPASHQLLGFGIAAKFAALQKQLSKPFPKSIRQLILNQPTPKASYLSTGFHPASR